jgi:glycosyltransferase involved in cell wall biosynthesis
MAALEAMASGLPVVATNSGGLPEVLAGGGGILVARESASELAQALDSLATDRPLRQRLAHEAYASFQESFTWEAVRRNYQKIVKPQLIETVDVDLSTRKKVFVS